MNLSQGPVAGDAEGPGLLLGTEALLVSGGDDRITLDPTLGVNKYGLAPRPDGACLDLGSSTASTITPLGFAAAQALRDRLLPAIASSGLPALYTRELTRMRALLLERLGLEAAGGTDIIFAASGTHLHLLAPFLAGEPGHLQVITVAAAETGSGVPAALAGQHFNTVSPLGPNVAAGTTLGAQGYDVTSVALREADGRLRSPGQVDAEFMEVAAAAIARGQRVLLVPVDVSKTGLIAPSIGCSLALQQRWPGAVDVMVDACQFRLSAETARAYLAQGAGLAITGSKFLTGPSFSGALLLPENLAERWRRRSLPAALGAYGVRGEFPPNWPGASTLASQPNLGLLLRWEAAFAEQAAFLAVPQEQAQRFLQEMATAALHRLNSDPHFAAVEVAPLCRRELNAAPGWDDVQTIFPFRLVREGQGEARVPLSAGETVKVYRRLLLGDPLADGPCAMLGQPVASGHYAGEATSALRLCFSARSVVAAAAHGDASIVIADALAALTTLANLVQRA